MGSVIPSAAPSSCRTPETLQKTVLEDTSKVHAWREYKGLTQKAMAKRLNVTQGAYSQMEKPSANLRSSTLAKIAEAMGIHMEQFVEP
jgi:transcriptional regulator with XRE-family HTH domain